MDALEEDDEVSRGTRGTLVANQLHDEEGTPGDHEEHDENQNGPRHLKFALDRTPGGGTAYNGPQDGQVGENDYGEGDAENENGVHDGVVLDKLWTLEKGARKDD